MINVEDAILYGFIQGISEFLPVSSSGHLALLPHLKEIPDPGVVFDLMMHFGTAFAVLLYFRQRLWKLIRTFTPSLADFKQESEDQWFLRNFIYSTFVSVVFIVLFMPIAREARQMPFVIFNLSFFGLLLWFSDLVHARKKNLLLSPMTSAMQWKVSALIGLAQAFAIFPGVSRSGITLTMALFLGMTRKEASEYSFLLSLPIIFAGILKEMPELVQTQNHSSFLVLLMGVVTSFVVGFLTIHFFMKLIARVKLFYFTIYRVGISLLMFFFV